MSKQSDQAKKQVNAASVFDVELHVPSVMQMFTTMLEQTQKKKPAKIKTEPIWKTCACGKNHPYIVAFEPPNGKKCTFYLQLSDKFQLLTLHRVLYTEIKFVQADENGNGLIEYSELKKVLQTTIGSEVDEDIATDTFNQIDTDHSKDLDFLEVLSIVETLVQRRENALPEVIKKNYDKACTMQ